MSERYAKDDSGFSGSFLGSLADSVLHIGIAQLQNSNAVDNDLPIWTVAPLERDLYYSRALLGRKGKGAQSFNVGYLEIVIKPH